MSQFNLKEIPVDERILRKSGAQFKGRVLKDKEGKVEIQIERDKGVVPLDGGQQCILSVVNAGDKSNLLTGVIVDLLTKVLGGVGADGRPTKNMSIQEMRPYTRVIEAFRSSKDGLVDLDDEDLKYLQRKFSALTIVPHPDSAPIIVAIDNFLSKEVSRLGQAKEVSKS